MEGLSRLDKTLDAGARVAGIRALTDYVDRTRDVFERQFGQS